jgi:fatty acid synthase, animal type
VSLPAYMLQLMGTKDVDSLQDIARAVFDDVRSLILNKEKENFYLVGYSFGALITIELVHMLEESGLRGQVVLVDGAPGFLKKLVVDQMPSAQSDEAVQNVLISGVMRNIFPEEKVDVMQIMKNYPTWELRVEKVLEMATDQYLYSTDYLRTMANCLFQRLKMVINYKPTNKMIKSPITLIRPTEISIVDVEEDYGIQKLTRGNTNVKYVEGNHLTMLENSKLIQIINELDPALEANRSFKKHNAI